VLNPDHVELRQLSVEEIGKVLRNNNLGLYEEEFGKNCVDGETLAVRR
jgi:ribosomal protein L29